MKIKKAAATSLAIATLSLFSATELLAMCGGPLPDGNIILVVPAGGNVTSVSTDHDCATEQTCDYPVPSSPFSDTFTANPDTGYKFVGWKDDGITYLCGGESGDCIVSLTAGWTAVNSSRYLEPIFEELDLLDLVPAATRGAFQVYPGEAGALDLTSLPNDWGLGPLQMVDAYSAGMNIAADAGRLVLSQSSVAPDQFLLLAELATSDVDTVSAGAGLTNLRTYQGYDVWEIGTTGLQLAKVNDLTLAIGTGTAVDEALDAYTGLKGNIETGILADYAAALKIGPSFANSFVYGLPGLYGPVPAPGSGDYSLSQSMAINSIFNLSSGDIFGAVNFFGDNAASYREKYQEQTAGFNQVNLQGGNQILIVLLQSLPEADLLPLLKTLVLDMDAVDYASTVVHGGNNPFLNFAVGENPNSIFINFEFTGQQARNDFEANHLPPGFNLAPLSIVAGEPARYFLVLNVYRSGGNLVSGARAEWSVFVDDPYTGEPRFLVIQAAADQPTADSVNGLIFAGEDIFHELTPTAIETCYEIPDCSAPGTPTFASSINWPQVPETRVEFERQFVVANDYIFWGNGVADRGLYNSSVFNREAVLVDPAQFTFTDNTQWAAFVNAAPVHALVYLNPLEIVVSPWWNLDEPYLDAIIDVPGADPDRAWLTNFKNAFYLGLVTDNAEIAIQGGAPALATTTISDSVPTARYHFPLLNPIGLLADVAGPGMHVPVQVELFDGDLPAHYVTLNVYQRETDTCGIRAEWVTYVEGDDGRPETLRLDSVASQPCLEPISLMTLAANVTQYVNGVSNDLETSINTEFVQFEAAIDLDSTTGAQVGLSWLESGDRSCSLNDVCDDFFIEGQHLMEDAERGTVTEVTINSINTPWDVYIDTVNVVAGARLVPALQAYNPWLTTPSYAAP